MRIKTSTVIGLAIATVLTAYISALSLSNQSFAIEPPRPGFEGTSGGTVGGGTVAGAHTLAGHEARLGIFPGSIQIFDSEGNLRASSHVLVPIIQNIISGIHK